MTLLHNSETHSIPTDTESTLLESKDEISRSETYSLDGDEKAESRRSFAFAAFKAYERVMSDHDRLSVLYQLDKDQFETEIETQVQEYLDDDEDYQAFFSKVKEARRYDNAGGDAFIPEIKARRAAARQLVITSLDLPENLSQNEIEKSTKNIAHLLKDVPKDSKNINLALTIIGAKEELEEQPGEYEYTFPYDLLPESVNNKWADYLETVKDSIRISQHHAANPTEDTANETVSKDATRANAHGAITRIVHPILGLGAFGLEETDTRKLLARMRNDELMLDRKPHHSIHKKSPEQIAIAKKLARKQYDH